MREIIQTQRLDMGILNGMKTGETERLRTAWPVTGLERILPIRNDVTAAPRAGVTIMICPATPYAVAHVYNAKDPQSNGAIEGLTVEFGWGRLVTGTYVSLGSTSRNITTFLDTMIQEGTNSS